MGRSPTTENINGLFKYMYVCTYVKSYNSILSTLFYLQQLLLAN